jgi:hypothetical protein
MTFSFQTVAGRSRVRHLAYTNSGTRMSCGTTIPRDADTDIETGTGLWYNCARCAKSTAARYAELQGIRYLTPNRRQP